MDNNLNTKKNNTLKRILNIVVTVLVWLYVVAVIIFSVSIFSSMGTGYPNLFGNYLLYIETDSMEDTLMVGDMVICESRDDHYKSVEIGDIIAFRDTKRAIDESTGEFVGEEFEVLTIHRVVGKDGDYFITQGDHEEQADEIPVAPTRVLGVYNGTRIPKLGKVFQFLSDSNGILICLVIPMAAFFIYALFKFVKAMIEFKMEKATAGAPGAELTDEQKQAAIEEYLRKQAEEAAEKESEGDNSSETNE